MRRSVHDLLLKGQNILVNGNKNSYQITKSLKEYAFKGYVQETQTPVMLKFEDNPVIHEREVSAYEFDCIRDSPYIRVLRENIDNDIDKCMVLEWMDTDLWSIRRGKKPMNPVLPNVMAKSILKALSAFSYMDGQNPSIHGDINPNNILISDADAPLPLVKVGDLENVITAGQSLENRFQGFEIRAPEIWKRAFASPACDIWSLGVTMTHYLTGKCIFGATDIDIQIKTKSREVTKAAWSIGKVTKLIGPFTRDEDLKFRDEFDVADYLLRHSFIKIGSLEEELAKFDVPKDCVEFIRYLLVLEPKKRPTAEEALNHPWLQDIK